MGLGTQLRDARITAGLTISEVAERSGLSTSYVSEVERDRANPSVGVVNRVAKAIGIRIGSLFQDDCGEPAEEPAPALPSTKLQPKVIRHDRRKRLIYPGSHVVIELLSPDLQHAIEVQMSRSPAGTQSGDEKIQHVGEECAIVLQGTMALTVADEQFVLEAGDSIYFDANDPHSWRNVGTVELEAIWVITPPHF
jgi:transcriptional regulator with XRE-family HTH domain